MPDKYILLVAAVLFIILIVTFLKRINLQRGLLFLLTFLPFYFPILWLTGFHPVARSWANIIAIIMMIAIYIRLCVDDGFRKEFKLNSMDIIMICFILYGLFLVYHTYTIYDTIISSVNGFRTYFFGGIYYLICRAIIREKQDVEIIINRMTKVIFFISILLIIEFIVINIFRIEWINDKLFAQSGSLFFDETQMYYTISSTIHRPVGILFHPHQSAYLIAILVVFILFLRQFVKKNSNSKLYYIAFMALLFTTARLVILSTLLIIVSKVYLLKRINIKRRHLFDVFLPICIFIIIIIVMGKEMVEYFKGIGNMSDTFFESMRVSRFSNIGNIKLSWLLFGRGIEPAYSEREELYEQYHNLFGEEAFSFRRFTGEIHILLHLDAIGLFGGILLILQLIPAIIIGLKMSRKEKDPFLKGISIGLSSCIILGLLVSLHLHQTSAVLQLYNYTILAIISSLKKVSLKELIT